MSSRSAARHEQHVADQRPLQFLVAPRRLAEEHDRCRRGDDVNNSDQRFLRHAMRFGRARECEDQRARQCERNRTTSRCECRADHVPA